MGRRGRRRGVRAWVGGRPGLGRRGREGKLRDLLLHTSPPTLAAAHQQHQVVRRPPPATCMHALPCQLILSLKPAAHHPLFSSPVTQNERERYALSRELGNPSERDISLHTFSTPTCSSHTSSTRCPPSHSCLPRRLTTPHIPTPHLPAHLLPTPTYSTHISDTKLSTLLRLLHACMHSLRCAASPVLGPRRNPYPIPHFPSHLRPHPPSAAKPAAPGGPSARPRAQGCCRRCPAHPLLHLACTKQISSTSTCTSVVQCKH